MSESPFFRTDKKSVQFREWLDGLDVAFVKLEEGAFAKKAFRSTGVNTRLIKITKRNGNQVADELSTESNNAEEKVDISAGSMMHVDSAVEPTYCMESVAQEGKTVEPSEGLIANRAYVQGSLF